MTRWLGYLLTLLVLPACLLSCKKDPNKGKDTSRPDNKVGQALGDVTDMYAKQFEGESDLNSENDTLNRAIEAARQAEQSSTGQPAANHMVLRHWLTLMRDHNLDQAEHKMLIEAASTYRDVSSPEDIDKLSQKIHQYIQFNNGVIEKTKSGWMKQLKELSEKEGMDAKLVTKAVEETARGFERIKPILIVIRQKDNEVCQSILEQHTILKNAQGSWKWNTEKMTPVFDSADHQKAFDQTHQKIEKIIGEQNAAQARILAIQQGM